MRADGLKRFVKDAYSKGGLVPYDFDRREEPSDWALDTARAIFADLQDYHALRWPLDDIPWERRRMMVDIIAEVVREGDRRRQAL